MAIDFEIPAEAKAIRERVRQWVHDECIPAEKRLVDGADYKTVLTELRQKARGAGSLVSLHPARSTAAWASGRSPTRWCRWSSARATSARSR